MINALKLMRQAVQHAHRHTEEFSTNEPESLERAAIYASIAQAEALTRIAQALEKLTDNCVDTAKGAIVVKKAEQ